MYRYFIIAILLIVTSLPSLAESSQPTQATYLLQVSSNLNCDALDIELISKDGKQNQSLQFTKSAFAAIDLPAGGYDFGDVSCTVNNGTEKFSVLKDKISPLYLNPGQAYYGGRIIFKKVEESDPSGTPDVINNCTQIYSKARGESDTQCRDGVGVSGASISEKQIAVYAPDESDEDVQAVRTALKVSKEQLLYLPLKVSDS